MMANGLTEAASPSRQQEVAAPVQQHSQVKPNEPTEPCAWELKRFLHCASTESDLTHCEVFNETLQQCKINNRK